MNLDGVSLVFIQCVYVLLGPPPDAYQAYLQESNVACVLAMYYTLHTANRRDKVALMRVLGTLATCHQNRAYQDTFLHSLVSLQQK